MSNGGECKKQTGEWCCQAVGCAAAAVVVDTRCMCCCRLCNSVLLESSQLTSVCCCWLLLLFVLFTFLFSLFISLLEISCFCLGFLALYTCKYALMFVTILSRSRSLCVLLSWWICLFARWLWYFRFLSLFIYSIEIETFFALLVFVLFFLWISLLLLLLFLFVVVSLRSSVSLKLKNKLRALEWDNELLLLLLLPLLRKAWTTQHNNGEEKSLNLCAGRGSGWWRYAFVCFLFEFIVVIWTRRRIWKSRVSYELTRVLFNIPFRRLSVPPSAAKTTNNKPNFYLFFDYQII